MKKICLCFQIHQPLRLRRYRFFDIAREHYYYDEFQNIEIFQRIADICYLPANRMLLDLLRTYPDFKVSFSISGLAIEQMEVHKPDLLDSFQELVATGRVEMLATPYAYSLSSLIDPEEFREQIQEQQTKLRDRFGAAASEVLCNTELIYSDEIAHLARSFGFKGMITEGAKHVLGWKSPNYIYSSVVEPELKLLLRNSGLTELITQEFSRYDSPEYPVTADKMLNRIKWLPQEEEVVNLYMNYEVLGGLNRAESGIFDFFRALPALSGQYEVGFALPSELIKSHKAVGSLEVSSPISSSGEAKSTNDWTGNVLQKGVLTKLADMGERVRLTKDNRLRQDWRYLQSADHLYYMNTGSSGRGFSPYNSAYDAFNNYMNVLSDFKLRLEKVAPQEFGTDEISTYEQMIDKQNEYIESLKKEIEILKSQIPAKEAPKEKKPRAVAKRTKSSAK
ncbi:glycoside hydrolase family 57 protein [Porphyromonas sp. COT-290 OH860]|uniref:glycoside hydrolase family 57 protein n=1 Tax=Porphyromonas sp. COT-290 OH860 TaxID=1515615 RepID=UPI00052C2CDD|nr:glycoside hydrolase family 57 protein [Porphyromonas sp. COT-290 OH860]KGN84980.1 alpha-amylase [Porphyromonas sp. COT-290 OH860]